MGLGMKSRTRNERCHIWRHTIPSIAPGNFTHLQGMRSTALGDVDAGTLGSWGPVAFFSWGFFGHSPATWDTHTFSGVFSRDSDFFCCTQHHFIPHTPGGS